MLYSVVVTIEITHCNPLVGKNFRLYFMYESYSTNKVLMKRKEKKEKVEEELLL